MLDVHPYAIQDDMDLESLGLDSLTSIEALHALKNESGLDLPRNFFVTFPTIHAVNSYISMKGFAGEKLEPLSNHYTDTTGDEQVDPNHLIRARWLDVSLVPIQDSKSGRAPLFHIHDGSGLVHY